VAVIAGQQHGPRAPTAASLPSTPRAWVDQWAAASLNDPGHVCGRLFAPALASAFSRTQATAAWPTTETSRAHRSGSVASWPMATPRRSKRDRSGLHGTGATSRPAQPRRRRMAGHRNRARWLGSAAIGRGLGLRGRKRGPRGRSRLAGPPS
jgi:hypothetical protein